MPDTAAGFTLGHKGLTTATALGSGDLLVSGYLTRWDELDRQSERMVRGSFSKSIPTFLAGHSPFVYGHRLRDVLGTVLSLEEDNIGVKMLARVNRQPESSPLRWVYEAIRNRSIKGLSVGALFKRVRRPDGTNDIVGVDIVECSATATPQLASTGFEVVTEGKALELFGRSVVDLDALALEATRLELRLLAHELGALSRIRA